jgi:hypothetical protein
MNTLFLFIPAGSVRKAADENGFQLRASLPGKSIGNEYFFLGIPFAVAKRRSASLSSHKTDCGGFVNSVGAVPHRVQKVSFRPLWPQALVTLVNNVF